jgi:GABA(A) receptor-associated protein
MNFVSRASNYLTHTLKMPVNRSQYYDTHTYEYCIAEVAAIRQKYPDRLPVLVEQASSSRLTDIDKKKFLVPKNLTVGQFIYVIRKRISLAPETGLFIFIENTMPNQSSLISSLYAEFCDERGFLVIKYAGENVFG